MSKEFQPMACPRCGGTMNWHGEKLMPPRTAEETRHFDARLGGVVEEAHSCPKCGANAVRVAA